MRTLPERAALPSLVGLMLVALPGCVDESVVRSDSDLFDDPPTAAQGFLGYSDEAGRLTVCGNCHVEKQSEWEGSGHAHAWSTLQGSGEAEQSCETCHTVNAYGNAVTGDAGWVATQDTRFHDVQCESCHGPGLTHVTNPTDANVPLASVAVGLEATNGCGECHQNVHHPILQDWEASKHANLYPSVASRPECSACHTGNHALEAWGVQSTFVEAASGTDYPITCAVCHDPHGGSNPGSLRFRIDAASVETNLCMKCHQRLGNPDLQNASAGPHSPQGPLLIGTAGWWPPNLQWSKIVSSHGAPEVNARLCAACHVASFDVLDAATGSFVVEATGHIFSPIPCLDEQGRPTVQRNCSDSERTYRACAGSGCHEDEGAARAAKATAQTRIADLQSALGSALNQLPDAEFDPGDRRYTVAEGAEFNRKLARGGAHVHNPFLTETLLIASIEAVQREYGVAPAAQAQVSLTPVLRPGGTQ